MRLKNAHKSKVETSFGISLWATFKDNAGAYRYLTYFGDDVDSGGPRYVIAKTRSGWNNGRIYSQTINPKVEASSLLTGSEIPLDTRLHIVSIIDQDTDALSLYINDILQETVSIGDFSLADVCEKVSFGRSIAPEAGYPDWHYAAIDDVAIYVPELTMLLLLGLGAVMLRKRH